MHEVQPAEADEPLERVEGLSIPSRGREVLARGQQMACVEADSDANVTVRAVDNRGKLFEA